MVDVLVDVVERVDVGRVRINRLNRRIFLILRLPPPHQSPQGEYLIQRGDLKYNLICYKYIMIVTQKKECNKVRRVSSTCLCILTQVKKRCSMTYLVPKETFNGVMVSKEPRNAANPVADSKVHIILTDRTRKYGIAYCKAGASGVNTRCKIRCG
jgi:hypothetical protein